MKTYTKGKITLIHGDCMEYMAGLEDGAFTLSLIDPPYGIDAGNMQMGKGKAKAWGAPRDWDKAAPGPEFFAELMRVSGRQVIFGANYFCHLLPQTGGWIFWDKMRDKDVSFSDGELAWTSFLNVMKTVRVRYDGFIGRDLTRIHPTQKPVLLYQHLMAAYSDPGDRILDTHLGSGSSAIAAYYAGLSFVGVEIDADYYDAAIERFERETAQFALL